MQEDAEAGCEVDWSSGQRSGPDCLKLESFESFVREIGGSSPMSSFAHMLYRLRRREQKVPTEEGDATLQCSIPLLACGLSCLMALTRHPMTAEKQKECHDKVWKKRVCAMSALLAPEAQAWYACR